jgi:hypothetical protein
MKIVKGKKIIRETHTWEEDSGLIDFLSSINAEVEKFNENFGFGINNMARVPVNIDGNTELPLKVGFVLERLNPLLPELTYCLYSLLKNRLLYGYVGLYRDGSIQTLKDLKPIKDFKKERTILYEWLSQLVRASCEKRML